MRTIKKLFIIFLLLTSLQGVAQNISIGPAVSFGSSWVSFDQTDSINSQFHPAFSGGVFIIYSPSSTWGFGADLLYSREGATVEQTILGSKFISEVNFDYIRIPLKAIYFFNEYGDPVRPKIFIGPQIGFLLAAKFEDVDVMDAYNPFDAGIVAGAGANMRLAEAIWLNVDVHYYQGLVDISDNTFTDERNLNSNAAITVGVAFGLGANTNE
ncbi:MAG: PorT family protein [Fimbriimonadaceae bacterium]|nr:PorT family protein [Chitinophagales bacterium]